MSHEKEFVVAQKLRSVFKKIIIFSGTARHWFNALDYISHTTIIAYCQQNRYVRLARYTDLFTLTKAFLLGTFLTITLGVYNLLRNDLIRINEIQINEIRGKIILHEDSLQMINSKWNVLESQHMLKLPWSNVYKSPLFWCVGIKLS